MKQIAMIAGLGDAHYVEEIDAYTHGLVVDDDSKVEITDLVITREKEKATIYYVISTERIVEDLDDEVPAGDEAEASQPG